MMNKTITVGVHGGLVQWVRDVPAGVEVRVQDYDTDGMDSGIVSSDSEGNRCVVAIYRGRDDA